MKEFDYDLDYKQLDFTDSETRKLYRIGRGEQGVLLVRPYTDNICAHWRFVDEETAVKSSDTIYQMFCTYRRKKDFIGMDMARRRQVTARNCQVASAKQRKHLAAFQRSGDEATRSPEDLEERGGR